MPQYRLLMNYCRVCLVAFISVATLLIAPLAQGQQENELVEVHIPAGATAPYQTKRGPWSVRFAVTSETLFFHSADSALYVATFEDIFGKSKVAINQIQLGPQWNTPIGSLGLDLIYGQGSIQDGRSGDRVTLSLQKKGAALMYSMDTLFAEPYFAPYASVQAFTFDHKETSGLDGHSVAKSTALTSAYSAGIHFYLNWLDESASRRAYHEGGLVATMVDVYAIKYQTSTQASDTDLQTDWEYGAGLRLEF